MRILITGANGFIGAYLTAYLLQQGHHVTCCVRDIKATQRRFPSAKVIACDFNHDITIDAWLPRLDHIDAVINCAGVLTGSARQNMNNIHYHTPLALFKACEQRQIQRVIQISALGVEDGPNIDYVTSKRKLDQALLAMNLSSCILRPSLVYASGSYGGTALLRALSALPFIIPLIGKGDTRFQPIAMFDLVKVVMHVLETQDQGIINVVGPEPVTIKEILQRFRQWLGLKPVKTVMIPLAWIKLFTRLGDFLGSQPLNSTSLSMTLHENIADPKPLQSLVNFKLTPFSRGLEYYPSQTQDRWHARLYFVRPLLQFSLVLLWLLSGLIPLIYSQPAENLLIAAGFERSLIPLIRISSCLWDIFLGLSLAFSFKNKLIGALQFITVLAYTAAASISLSLLWLDPLAPLLKNIPILAAILVWLAIEDHR